MRELRKVEGLAQALLTVQKARGGRAPREWSLLAEALAAQVRKLPVRQQGDEVLSQAFLNLCRSRGGKFSGSTDASANAYLRTTAYNAFRTFKRQEARERRRLSKPRADGLDPLDQLAAPEPDLSQSEAAYAWLDDAKDQLRGYIDLVLDEAELRPKDHQMRWNQAQSCVLTVLEKKDAATIKQQLGVSVSKDAIYKWTERGRPVVLEALERWGQSELDEDDARAVQYLRGMFEKRRADAGKARPTRQKAGRKPPKKKPKSAHTGRPDRGSVSSPRNRSSVQYGSQPTQPRARRPASKTEVPRD